MGVSSEEQCLYRSLRRPWLMDAGHITCGYLWVTQYIYTQNIKIPCLFLKNLTQGCESYSDIQHSIRIHNNGWFRLLRSSITGMPGEYANVQLSRWRGLGPDQAAARLHRPPGGYHHGEMQINAKVSCAMCMRNFPWYLFELDPYI